MLLGPPGKSPQMQDVAAQNDANYLISELAHCYAHTKTYARCKESNGEAMITGATTDSWTIVSHSESGTYYSVEYAVSLPSIRHRCTPPGKGSCLQDGTW